MTWALWLAAPVLATAAAAAATWWSGRRASASRTPSTELAMRAHREFLQALAVPARGAARVDHSTGVDGDAG